MTDDHEADLRTLVREFRSSVSAELSAQNKAMLNLATEIRDRLSTTETAIMNAIGDLSREMNRRFGEVEFRLDSLEAGQRRHERRLDGIDERLDGIDERLDGIDERLDGIDERLDGIDERLDGIDGRLDGIDGRLDRLEDHARSTDGRLSRIEGKR